MLQLPTQSIPPHQLEEEVIVVLESLEVVIVLKIIISPPPLQRIVVNVLKEIVKCPLMILWEVSIRHLM